MVASCVLASCAAVMCAAVTAVNALPLLVFQQVRVVYRRGPAGPEDRHQDPEADHDLRGGHHHHEERDDMAVQVAVQPGERDEREIGRVQHQLNAHEDDDRVAPHEHAHAADHEEDHGERHVMSRAHERASSSGASILAWGDTVPPGDTPYPDGPAPPAA